MHTHLNRQDNLFILLQKIYLSIYNPYQQMIQYHHNIKFQFNQIYTIDILKDIINILLIHRHHNKNQLDKYIILLQQLDQVILIILNYGSKKVQYLMNYIKEIYNNKVYIYSLQNLDKTTYFYMFCKMYLDLHKYNNYYHNHNKYYSKYIKFKNSLCILQIQ